MKDNTDKTPRRRASKSKHDTEQTPVQEAASHAGDIASDLHDQGQTLFDDAGRFVSSLKKTTDALQDRVNIQAGERPYILMGAAMSVGFVLGGGLTIRMSRTLISLGGRLLLSAAAKEVASRAGIA